MTEVSRTRAKWNQRWSEPDCGALAPEPHELAERLRHRFAGGAMLDAATGLGRGIATAGDDFGPIYAVDLSDVAVSRARRSWGAPAHIRWIVGDVTALNWPADFFGLVCAFGFTDLDFFAKVKPCIAPGGMMLYEGFSPRQRELKATLDPAWTTTPAQMRAIFTDWEELICEESASSPFRLRFAAIRPNL